MRTMMIVPALFLFTGWHTAAGQIVEQKLTFADADSGDLIGGSVAITSDYAIVGAMGDGGYTGAAYLFERHGDSWDPEVKVTADDGAAMDYFGRSVSIDGPYAVVGAMYHNGWQGAAYVFYRDPAQGWMQQAKLEPSGGYGNMLFGSSVSISGDDIIVGAYGYDGNEGAAYVFTQDGSSWTEQAGLSSTEPWAGRKFGTSVDIHGDHAVIGAPEEDENGMRSGAAYVFKRTGTEWAQQQKLLASDGGTYDTYGNSVSIESGQVIVGAFAHRVNNQEQGAVYVYTRDGETWTETEQCVIDEGYRWAYFGYSVAISGNMFISGAHGLLPESAYLFVGESSDWLENAILTPGDSEEDDGYGSSVALSGYYAIVGSSSNNDTGGAYVYTGFPVGIEDERDTGSRIPSAYLLAQNYPNPFNPVTMISFDLTGEAGKGQPVKLTVYDLRGRRMRMLVDTDLEPGSHRVTWDGRDDGGNRVPSGVYLYTLRSGNESLTRKMLITK